MNKIESVDLDRSSAEFIDNQGVANFADAMRRKLEKKRAEGRGGWHDPDQCRLDTLAVMLLDHLAKGDPVDIGNFAMMLYNRGDGANGQPSVLGATFRDWMEHQLKARDNIASNLQAALDKAAARIAELERIVRRLEGERNDARRSLDKERNARRKPRRGEYVCTCGVYRFPHRFGGGRCSGKWIVVQQWESHYGSGECRHCNSLNRTEARPYCEVVEGGESVRECPVWQEFVRFNEIKLTGQP